MVLSAESSLTPSPSPQLVSEQKDLLAVKATRATYAIWLEKKKTNCQVNPLAGFVSTLEKISELNFIFFLNLIFFQLCMLHLCVIA